MLLWGTEYSSPFWLTFKQAQELGGTVREGERSERIVFYKQLPNREEMAELNEKENTDGKRPPSCSLTTASSTSGSAMASTCQSLRNQR
jgi:antirestriction protein ArdC